MGGARCLWQGAGGGRGRFFDGGSFGWGCGRRRTVARGAGAACDDAEARPSPLLSVRRYISLAFDFASVLDVQNRL
jgi:hypothetical protein